MLLLRIAQTYKSRGRSRTCQISGCEWKSPSRGDFLAKTHTYQLYFNLVRPNAHIENLRPWQIIERLAPRSPLELCLLPPVFLDYLPQQFRGIRCAQASLIAGCESDAVWPVISRKAMESSC
jgi:hypothetical protein